jgi:hypothetical protein
LGAGLGLLIASAARPTRGSTGEVEVAGYGGVSSGGWACGPTGHVAYGGVGTDVRLSQRGNRDPNGPGATGVVGVGLEHQSFECDGGCNDYYDEQGKLRRSSPPDGLLVGARARGGYTWKHFGVEGGALVYQGFESADASEPSLGVFPELELQGGTHGETSIYGVAGLGSRGVTTHQRPGAYVGVTAEGEAGRLDLRVGPARSGPSMLDTSGQRIDLGGRVRVSEELSIRAGGAVSFPEGTVDGEASLGLVGGF